MNNNENLEEMKKNTILMVQEQQALQKEIDTLNENIDRKNNVIAGLFAIIADTKDIDLLAKAGDIMKMANFED